MCLTVLAQGNGHVSFVFGAGDIFASILPIYIYIYTYYRWHSDFAQRKYPGIPTKENHAHSKAWTGGLLQQYFSPMQCQYSLLLLWLKPQVTY